MCVHVTVPSRLDDGEIIWPWLTWPNPSCIMYNGLHTSTAHRYRLYDLITCSLRGFPSPYASFPLSAARRVLRDRPSLFLCLVCSGSHVLALARRSPLFGALWVNSNCSSLGAGFSVLMNILFLSILFL
ncbi:hypothetical protein BJ322DRAFT_497474 [Thelephora terrestris]|uniref:Uncharacterized protein n=1 Tax=Thelephora terrestris TaxID=56493 RepID=A0A9P6H3J4_9AGAM|nr:hypothetical protein BJ322DRAFT_497474 [Thelephora terrestris]